MPEIRLTDEELRYIASFSELMQVVPRDCIIDKEFNRIIFVVEEGDAYKVLDSLKLAVLRKLFGVKDIRIVEYSPSPEQFIKNCFHPIDVKQVKITKSATRRKIAMVFVSLKDKSRAIGRKGERVKMVKLLVKRYFNIDNVIVVEV